MTRFALFCGLLLAGPAAGTEPVSAATVGMSARLDDLVIPGPELEAKPLAGREAAVVVRVVRVDPHGTAKRYALEWYGLDPGTYDLRNSLRRADGQPLGADVPSLPVRVDPVRPPGQVEPNSLPPTPTPRIGGYRLIVWAVCVLWGVGLVALLLSFFLPRRRVRAAAVVPVVSLADRLKPLVAGAVAGTLSAAELAALERALLTLWRKRLRLDRADPEAALARLHADPAAGPLLRQLEAWLHRPAAGEAIDVAALLAPYRSIAAGELDLDAGVPRG